jgi:hypothetical protein
LKAGIFSTGSPAKLRVQTDKNKMAAIDNDFIFSLFKT